MSIRAWHTDELMGNDRDTIFAMVCTPSITPLPTVQTIKTVSVRWWYLHALTEAALYGAPHDGRLQKDLRWEIQVVFDPHDVILWIGDRWPVKGRMECVRVHTGAMTEQTVNVWMCQQHEDGEWSVIAIQGPLPVFGRFSEYAVLPGARVCKRCGESHVKGCRTRFSCQRALDGQTQCAIARDRMVSRCGCTARRQNADNSRRTSCAEAGGRASGCRISLRTLQ